MLHPKDVQLLKNVAEATEKLAGATKNEMQLDHERHIVKMQAISRIIKGGDNPLTGKPHSFSSAELLVEQDAEYAGHLAKLRDAVEARIMARGNYEAAILEAQLTANAR